MKLILKFLPSVTIKDREEIRAKIVGATLVKRLDYIDELDVPADKVSIAKQVWRDYLEFNTDDYWR